MDTAPRIVTAITPEKPGSESAEQPTEAEATAEATREEQSTLPIPVSEPRQRRSLWRRITRRREPSETGSNGFQDLVKSRLDGITLRLESFEHGLARSDARLETGSC